MLYRKVSIKTYYTKAMHIYLTIMC